MVSIYMYWRPLYARKPRRLPGANLAPHNLKQKFLLLWLFSALYFIYLFLLALLFVHNSYVLTSFSQWTPGYWRLSADLPKPDKVLIVERVIDSLGLQTVRNSLVGTVEKRGISGGQRKRVNVGLEMVMEPSLLILDEPTSGLDSASSQLLLRALRREALEGVNICMVVHQPR